jgi:hypothetical protein
MRPVVLLAARLALSTLLFLVPSSAMMFSPGAPDDDGALPVRHTEGLVHGFLALRSLEGKTLAVGDLIQVAHGDEVTSKLIFHFKDGSIRSETTVFSQGGEFHLISDHLIEKGPAFKRSAETSIDVSTGEVSIHYTDDDGKEKVEDGHFTLPPSICNGLIFTLLKNIQPTATETRLSMVVTTPKPRLVKLIITPQGEDSLLIGGSRRKAMHFVAKIELSGVAGVVAPIIGKTPPDTHVWILGGEAPAFVKFEGPMYQDGPTWRIELTSPVWPAPSSKTKQSDKSKDARDKDKSPDQDKDKDKH